MQFKLQPGIIMSIKKHIIDTIDDEGKRVILTRKKWKEKSKIHPILTNNTFLRNLKQAIEAPEQVWEDKSNKKDKRCYYKKYSTDLYVKAVVLTVRNPYCIISAFASNKIKESIYPGFKRLR